MRLRNGLLTMTVISFLLLGLGLCRAQEAAKEEPAAAPAVPAPAPSEYETQWLPGEVVSLDLENKTLVLKYLDFETDQEKDITFNIDEKTTFENVKSLEEINPKDTVSVDYKASPDGKNIAINISSEKLEPSAVPQEATVEEVKPESAQPEKP